MAQVIEFYITARFKPRVKWVPRGCPRSNAERLLRSPLS